MNHRKSLTSNQIQQIRDREQSATNGPWTVREHHVDHFTTDRSITTTWEDAKTGWPIPIVSVSQSEHGAATWASPSDASFIAQAREDIPQLLSTLDVFGHQIVYEALLRYYDSGASGDTDRRVLEQALDTCWQLIRSRLPNDSNR